MVPGKVHGGEVVRHLGQITEPVTIYLAMFRQQFYVAFSEFSPRINFFPLCPGVPWICISNDGTTVLYMAVCVPTAVCFTKAVKCLTHLYNNTL